MNVDRDTFLKLYDLLVQLGGFVDSIALMPGAVPLSGEQVAWLDERTDKAVELIGQAIRPDGQEVKAA